MTKKEILKLIKLNSEIQNSKKVLKSIYDTYYFPIEIELREEKWFPNIPELQSEFEILKKEIYESKDTINERKREINGIIPNCSHQISSEKTSCFWGGLSVSNKCIFCDKLIDHDNEFPLITFQTFYDEYGDIIEPHFSLSNIYSIIEKILEKYNDNDEIDLIKEIGLLDLNNVKTNKNQKYKVRKRQEA